MRTFCERLCPTCGGNLPKNRIRLFAFDCPHCSERLEPIFFLGYQWVKFLLTLGLALALAWHGGWTGSSVIFVISFYQLPLYVFLWDLILREFYLPRKFKAAPSSSFLTLDLISK
jgi:hypothetical protein